MLSHLNRAIFFVMLLVVNILYSQKDYGLVAAKINTSPLPEYDYNKLDYGMTIGIQNTKNGRIWAAWIAGGDDEKAFFVLNYSDDKGKSWSKPKVVVDPHLKKLDEERRALVGNLWLDPKGKLWLFYDQGMGYFDGRAGTWSITTDKPDDENPTWSKPQRIWHGASLNKPIVLNDGSWMLPVSLWDRTKIKDKIYKDKFKELDSLRRANVFVSKDEGKSWDRKGGVRFPEPKFDEHCLIEKLDGSIWMTARTNDGIWESFSKDKGKSWSIPKKYMKHINSRHFMRRLNSGNILLIRHGAINEKLKKRSHLMAFLSKDEGKTWVGGLLLDKRKTISYPDGFQDSDGIIYIAYDRNRAKDGEILMATFTEDEIEKQKFNNATTQQRILISKPTRKGK